PGRKRDVEVPEVEEISPADTGLIFQFYFKWRNGIDRNFSVSITIGIIKRHFEIKRRRKILNEIIGDISDHISGLHRWIGENHQSILIELNQLIEIDGLTGTGQASQFDIGFDIGRNQGHRGQREAQFISWQVYFCDQGFAGGSEKTTFLPDYFIN